MNTKPETNRRAPDGHRAPFFAGVLPALCCFVLLLSSCGLLRGGAARSEAGASGAPETETVFSALMDLGRPQDLYGDIYDALSRYETEIVIKNSSAQEIKTAFLAVLDDHPELFWVANGYSSSGYSLGSASVVTLVPIITDSTEEIRQKQGELQEAVRLVLEQVPAGATDYEKALFFHDWLAEHTDYDLEAYSALTSSLRTPDRVIDSATAYGCLVKQLAICSGYSGAYQLLLQEAGIEAGRVSGTGRGGDHEWNYVVLDGDYYYVDATWDDPVREDGSFAACSHEYFCITSEELLRNHTLDPDQFIPQCTATKYNYYRWNGLFLQEYSFEAVSAIVEAHRYEGVIEMEFSTSEELRRAERELFEQQAVFNIPAVQAAGSGIAYSTGSTDRVLQLYLSSV